MRVQRLCCEVCLLCDNPSATELCSAPQLTPGLLALWNHNIRMAVQEWAFCPAK